MSEAPESAPSTASATSIASTAPKRSLWLRRLVLGVVGLGVVVLAYFMLSAFLPRWWAQQVGDVVAERFTVGTFFGLFLGFTFTVLPLVLLALMFRRRMLRRPVSWRTRAVLFVLAAVLAVPNLLTLAVVLGNGNAAHAGERIMDVEAPAFRGASLAGALLAVVAVALTLILMSSRRRTKRKLGSLRDRIRERDAAAQAGKSDEPGEAGEH